MRKIRILVAKVGCDIHERGALTMMTVYRDAGMETIYTGRFQSEEGVVNAAINENDFRIRFDGKPCDYLQEAD